jgi:hypothetical protein
MEASSEGAGRENTLGVNIELPFEQGANPYIDAETNLVSMKYFFTRKVAMTRPSSAFVAFPGGLGTHGRSLRESHAAPHRQDRPGAGRASRHARRHVLGAVADFIDERSSWRLHRAHATCASCASRTSVEDAVTEIERFYSNYVSFDDATATRAVAGAPTADKRTTRGSGGLVPIFASGEGFRVERHDVSFNFDGRNYANLRLIIDAINSWSA